jgi:hypothetical protein
MAIFFLFFGRLYYSCQQVVTTSPDAFIMRVEGGCVLLSAIEKGGAPRRPKGGANSQTKQAVALLLLLPASQILFPPKVETNFFSFFFSFSRVF